MIKDIEAIPSACKIKNQVISQTLTLADVVSGVYPEAASSSLFSCTTVLPTSSLKCVLRCRLSRVLPQGMDRREARSSEVKRTSYTISAPCTPAKTSLFNHSFQYSPHVQEIKQITVQGKRKLVIQKHDIFTEHIKI